MASASIAMLTTYDDAGPVFIVRYHLDDDPDPTFVYFFDRAQAWDYAQKIMDIAASSFEGGYHWLCND